MQWVSWWLLQQLLASAHRHLLLLHCQERFAESSALHLKKATAWGNLLQPGTCQSTFDAKTAGDASGSVARSSGQLLEQPKTAGDASGSVARSSELRTSHAVGFTVVAAAIACQAQAQAHLREKIRNFW